MKKRTWIGTLSIVTLLTGTMAGCSSDSGTENAADTEKKPAEEQVISLTLSDDIPTLDMSKATDGTSFTVAGQINEGLLRLDEKGTAVPGVAEKYETSPDGLKWTFYLRKDAKWSDGTQVTAKDFEYSWKRTLDPATASQYAFMVAWIKGGDAYNKKKGSADDVMVKAKDDLTLEVTLEQPVPFFAEQLAFPTFFPQKKEFVEKLGEKFGSEAEHALSNGPFKLSSWTHDQSVELVKNDTYWDKNKVKLEKVNFQILKDTSAQENLYASGQLDRFSLVREQIDRFKDTAEYSTVPELVTGYLLYNGKHKALQNVKIRKALTYAIDADKYADIIYHNGTSGATAFVGTGVSNGQGGEFRKDGGDLINRAANKAKAKQLLEEGLKEAGLTAFPAFKLMMADDDSNKKGAEFIKEQWRANLGIEVELENIPRKLQLTRNTKRDYDISFLTWGADYNDPMTYLDLWISGSDFNRVDYKSPKYDELIAKAKAEPDAKKRMGFMAEAEKVLMDDMPIGPVFFRAAAVASKPHVKNFVSRVFGPSYDLKFAYIEGKK